MMMMVRVLAILFVLLPVLGAAYLRGEEGDSMERVLQAGDVAPSAHTAQLDDSVDLSSFPAQGNVPQFVKDLVPGKVPDHVYQNTIKGMAIRGLSASQAADLSTKPGVANVEPDRIVQASAAASWGLDRVNQCELPLDDNDSPSSTPSVKMYIVDSGILSTHVDFENSAGTSRVSPTCSQNYASGSSTTEDGNGHGTHVASTACGNDFGVAKDCALCAIRVLDARGSGSTAGVIAGVDFVKSNCQAGEKCVANMSLGGGLSTSLNNAVNAAVASGVVFVVAAGNENQDANNVSPASASGAITVGATDSNDIPATFTNFGSAVNIYAPGVDITAAWYAKSRNSATRTISGTSMASPHVAGIAAIMLEQGVATTPASIAAELQSTQTVENVDCDTPNVGIAVVPGTSDCSSIVNNCADTGGGGGGSCTAVQPSCGVPCDDNCCDCQLYRCRRGQVLSLCTGRYA